MSFACAVDTLKSRIESLRYIFAGQSVFANSLGPVEYKQRRWQPSAVQIASVIRYVGRSVCQGIVRLLQQVEDSWPVTPVTGRVYQKALLHMRDLLTYHWVYRGLIDWLIDYLFAQTCCKTATSNGNRTWAGQPGTKCTYSCPYSLEHNFQKKQW